MSGQRATYVYCIAAAGALKDVAGPGADDPAPLRTLAAGPLEALCKEVPLTRFVGDEAEDRLQDAEWVAPRAALHERVVEAAMARADILPATFGTLFSSEQLLLRFLQEQQAELLAGLARVAGREEWSLKGYLRRKDAVALLAQGLIQEQEAALAPLSRGVRYLKERKLHKQAENNLRAWLDSTIGELEQRLAPLCDEAHARSLLSRESTGREDDMVFNWALLVPHEGVDALHAALDKQAGELAPLGLELERSGPWPPYSFCPKLEDHEA